LKDGRSLKDTDDERILKLAESILLFGLASNIQVWKDAGVTYCFDAHHRKKAFELLDAAGVEIPPLPATRCLAKTSDEAKRLLLLKESKSSWVNVNVVGDYMQEIGMSINMAAEVLDLPGIAIMSDGEGWEETGPAEKGDGLGTEEGTGVTVDKGALAARWGVAPFSILDAKRAEWQDRKRTWMGLGIKSELGRDGMEECLNTGIGEKYGRKEMTGVSIFDPVLCELMYKWFCPPGGNILDPFAGGSVRGIVAHSLGYKYTGIDIRAEQVISNRQQAEEILGKDDIPNWITGDSSVVLPGADPSMPAKVKISAKSLKQKFQPCEAEYIKKVCHGRCCEGSDGLMVTVHDTEVDKFSKLTKLDGNFILDESGTGICPFKKDDLCSIHEDKPFGCKASPFTLNKNNTLIIRNRYRMLRCYNTNEAVPAYQAHRWSLVQIFGEKEVDRIVAEIENGSDDVYANIDPHIMRMIKDNDASKHPGRTGGSSFNMLFTCPPYADLEVYSDMEGDISNMEYNQFREAYFDIISKGCAKLDDNSFAAIVVGEVRGKDGSYYNFVGDTIAAFMDAGLAYYNEIVFATMIGTLPIRAGRPFEQSRKIGKTHQNILVFCKGDPKKAASKIGEVHVGDMGEPDQQ
jgi:DNA modification methylase/Fe-S-cluster containining protein